MFARVNRRDTLLVHADPRLVVIHNLNLEGVAISPHKADPPLVIYANDALLWLERRPEGHEQGGVLFRPAHGHPQAVREQRMAAG